MKHKAKKNCMLLILLLSSTSTIYPNNLVESLRALKKKLIKLGNSLTPPKVFKISTEQASNTTDAASKYFDEKTLSIINTEKSQWTTFPSHKKLNLAVYNESATLFDKIPAIGHYLGEGYNFRNRLVTIEYNPKDLSNIAPQKLLSLIDTEKASFYITITGDVRDKNKDSLDKTYNILFHGFRAPDFDKNAKHFGSKSNENILMGVFDPDGIEDIKTNNSMPFNKLEKRSVHYHDFHFSPNNARIQISKSRSISIFWSVACAPPSNIKRIAVTYHLLLNDKETEKLFSTSFTQDSFENLLSQLEKTKLKLKNKYDQNALQKFINNLKKIIGL